MPSGWARLRRASSRRSSSPDEILNHDLNANGVGHKRARNRDELVANATEHLSSRAGTAERVAEYFRGRHVCYAA